MKNLNKVILYICMLQLISCTKFVDIKPDKKMTVPTSLEDCEALLDDRNTMNARYPIAGEVGSDNYYLTDANYNALSSIVDRAAYVWDPNTNFSTTQWSSSYKVILVANQVLEILNKFDRQTDPQRIDRLKGQALFFRAYAMSQLTPVFTLPYDPASAKNMLGLVLRMSPAIDYISVRTSLADTYVQIINDLNEAESLLPLESSFKTRPTKVATWALLSRVGLVISDFALAESVAKKVLNQNMQLLDYNSISKTASNPFGRFNKEVIFHASALTSVCLTPSIAKVDSLLYLLYEPNDLRRTIYFRNNNNGSYAFKGRYDGDINASSFAGLALDEVYFNYAEALVRNNKLLEALKVFNSLMKSRWTTSFYNDFKSDNKKLILDRILSERRKSLIMRNLRWSDIRRLNLEGGSIVLKRALNGTQYSLNSGDLRFAFLIPTGVMEYAPSIIQNKR